MPSLIGEINKHKNRIMYLGAMIKVKIEYRKSHNGRDKKGQRQGEVYNESKVSGLDLWVTSSATH